MRRLSCLTLVPLFALLFVGSSCKKTKSVPTAEASLCKPGELDGCQASCQEGNLESCNLMVQVFEASLPHKLDEFLGGEFNFTYDERYEHDKSHSAKYEQLKSTTLPYLEQACDDANLADACWLAGIMHYNNSQTLNEELDKVKEKPQQDSVGTLAIPEFNKFVETHKRTSHLLNNACKFGHSVSCEHLQAISSSIDYLVERTAPPGYDESKLPSFNDRARGVMNEVCAAGDPTVCLLVAKADSDVHNPTSSLNIPNAFKALENACRGGVAEACYWSALAYASKDQKTCVELVSKTATHDKIDYDSHKQRFITELHYLPVGPEVQEVSDQQVIEEETCPNLMFNGFEPDEPRYFPHRPELAFELANSACDLPASFLQKNTCELAKLIKP